MTDSLKQTHLQILLDSFRGELYAYGGDLPSDPYEASNWEHFVEAATILPELATDCHRLVEKRLGYKPPDSMIRPQAAFLRALIQHHRGGYLTDKEFSLDADQCIKRVRHRDMQIPLRAIDAAVTHERYASYLPAYGDRARDRLTQYLGYVPELEHSLIVELWLRQIMAREYFVLPNRETPVDIKAAMLVHYREAYAEGGSDAAYALPLPLGTAILKKIK